MPSFTHSENIRPLPYLLALQELSKTMAIMVMLSLSNKFQSLSGFEKIKVIGRGAYGTAVLYRKKDDNSMVVLKEINLLELNVSERQLAQNEVLVLSMLDHPNIIGYYDSFEENGILILEMEYADGGTLSQYLSQQEKPLREKNILDKFKQMASAIKYIHQHNILHRDLKTENIFLMHDEVVKIGDFGISKLMPLEHSSTTATVVGTPYYISPEMCEGKAYNNKSDIWALGCILYEMICFQKTFDGTNLPALVNKIMKGQFAPIKGEYSESLRSLLMDMLQKDPELRPSAARIHDDLLPEMMKEAYEKCEGCCSEANDGNKKISSAKKTRTLLYSFDLNNSSCCSIPMHLNVFVSQIAASSGHVIALTSDWLVFSWGCNEEGQLGLGDTVSRGNPELIEMLKEKSVVKVACGMNFSLFLSGNGIIMTCGSGSDGCLGHGDCSSISTPKLIEALLSEDISEVSCGPRHVVAVSSTGRVFGWGSGECGALGIDDESNQRRPYEMLLHGGHKVIGCFCGSSCTILLSSEKQLFASGDNRYDKLGLNYRLGFLTAVKEIFYKTESKNVRRFSLIKSLARYKVSQVHMGLNHTCVLVESGQIFMAGLNSGGQLGIGDLRRKSGFVEVPHVRATSVACGNNFTVAATKSDLIIWGCHRQIFLDDATPEPKSDSRASSAHSCSVSSEDGQNTGNSSSDFIISPVSLIPKLAASQLPLNVSNETEILKTGQSGSSDNSSQHSNLVVLACHDASIILSIESAASNLPGKNPRPTKNKSQKPKREDCEIDILCDSQPPNWLKKELSESEQAKDGSAGKKIRNQRTSNHPKSAGRFKQNIDIKSRKRIKSSPSTGKVGSCSSSVNHSISSLSSQESLKHEILNLKDELHLKENKLQENNLIIAELQERLKKLESINTENNQLDGTKSKICQLL